MSYEDIKDSITGTGKKVTEKIGDGIKSITEKTEKMSDKIKKPIQDFMYIKDKNKEIKQLIKEINEKVAPKREKINIKLEEFGKVKMEIIDTTISEFTNHMKDIKNLSIDETKNVLTSQHEGFTFSKKGLNDMQKSVLSVKNILKSAGTVGAAGAVGVAGVGAAYTAVAAFGAASTGTIISSLSGVAATNATLAWLGGGALAAGGGGMALGAIVLGGIAAVPIVSVLIVKGKLDYTKERKEVDQNYNKAISLVEKMDEFIDNHDDIMKFIDHTIFMVKRFKDECIKLNHQTDHIINQIGKNYEQYNDEQKSLIQKNITFITGLSAFMNTSIMDEYGRIHKEMGDISKVSNQFLNEAGEHVFVKYKKKSSIWIYVVPILICCGIAGYFYLTINSL